MSNSLQEQLLKAGLVTEEEVAKAEADAQRAKASARRNQDGRGRGRQGKQTGKGSGKKGRRSRPDGASKPAIKGARSAASAVSGAGTVTSAVEEANMSVGLRAAKRRTESQCKRHDG